MVNRLSDTYTLHNGVTIPCVGFGTWQLEDGEPVYRAVRDAIDAGYRHIDSAAIYENEQGVGRAVRDCGVGRGELFVTTKLWNDSHGYDKTMRAFEQSMKRLGLDYVDLYLIHWPVPAGHKNDYRALNKSSWKAFEELYRAGRIKAIGVSNFLVHHLQELLEDCEIKPMVNQVELHPEFTQEELALFCKNNSILIEAWSPLMQGRIFKIELLRELAQQYGKSVSQVALRWFVQKGYVPLPKASGREHIVQNGDLFGFSLSDEDMAKIDGLGTSGRIGSDPDHINF